MIANLTRSTGVSSDMILSAVAKSKKGELSLQQYDDGTNQYFLAVDQEGNIANKQLIGPSKPKVGTQTEKNKAELEGAAESDVASGITAEDLANKYSGTIEDWRLINLYNESSPHGPMTEKPEEFKKFTESEKKTTTKTNEVIKNWVDEQLLGGVSRDEIIGELENQGYDPNLYL